MLVDKNKFTLTLDSSQIFEFMMCPLKWHYHYRENLKLDTKQKAAPDKGTLVHHLLDIYYNLRWLDSNTSKFAHINFAVEQFKKLQVTKSLFPMDNGELEDFICNRFILYAQRYINEDFILPKTKVASPVELGFSKLLYEDDKVRFIVEGRIDLINLIQGDLPCWTDHKTQDRKSDLYKFKPQFKTYAWATGYDYGIINYFGLQDKYVENNTFRRDLICFPRELIKQWELKLKEIFWQVTYLITHQDFSPFSLRQEEFTIYPNRNDSYCSGAFDCHPCEFTHICEETNWDYKQGIKDMKYLKVEPWSPWVLKNEKEIKL